MVNAKEARTLPHNRHIAAIVAGSAPTASLLASLESLGFSVNHVYGLTYASITYHLSSFVMRLIREVRHPTSAANFSMRLRSTDFPTADIWSIHP